MELSDKAYYEEQLKNLNPKIMKSGTVIVECPGEVNIDNLDTIEAIIKEKGYVPNAVLPNYNPITDMTELHIHTYFEKSKIN